MYMVSLVHFLRTLFIAENVFRPVLPRQSKDYHCVADCQPIVFWAGFIVVSYAVARFVVVTIGAYKTDSRLAGFLISGYKRL